MHTLTHVSALLLLTACVHSTKGSNDWESHFDSNAPSGIFMPSEDPCKPEQVHLSFGDSVDEISVVWATKAKCLSQVKYAAHPWGFEKVVTGDYAHFRDLNAKGRQHLYRVKLQNLLPATEYYYIPISNGSSAGPFYFQTLTSGNDWSPDFLMFGDLGIHADTIPSLISEALSGKYAALIHVGDIAYDMHNEEGLLGDYFMNLIQPMASSIPYMTCPGNHEINSDTFNHYRYRFAMPGSEWPIPLHQMWYSIDIGPVHFVSYSSEVFFTNDGYFIDYQREWLEKDLLAANKNRNITPWIVAFGHRPLYCSTRIGDDCSKDFSYVRNGLEDIFHSFSVDFIIQAHEHNYERLWPVYKDKVVHHSYENPTVPVQIITGAAGSREGTDHFVPGDRPPWSAFRLDEMSFNSYGRLLVVNHTHLYWEQRSIYNHHVIDNIWVTQESRNMDVANMQKMTNSFSSNAALYIGISFLGIVLVIVLAIPAIRILLKHYRKKSFFEYLKNDRVEYSEAQKLPDVDSDSDFER